MEILFLLDYYSPHRWWIENVFEHLINWLLEKWYKITLITSRFQEDLKEYVDYDLNDTIIKVFECGLNSRHIPYNPRDGWDGSDLDKILSNCLRKLNVTQGDSYYKGIFYRIFLLGYYYSWNEIQN